MTVPMKLKRKCVSAARLLVTLAPRLAKPCCQSRSDVCSEDQGKCRRQSDDPFHRKSNHQARGHRRALDQRREYRPRADTKKRDFAEPHEEVNEALAVLERPECVRHEVQPEEQDAKSKNGFAHSLAGLALDEELHHDADQHEEPHQLVQLEHDDLGCDGCADVGTEDDAHGLPQRHQSCVGKPDDHHGRGSAALDDARDQHADQHPTDRLVGKGLKDASERIPGCLLKSVAKQFHAVKEE